MASFLNKLILLSLFCGIAQAATPVPTNIQTDVINFGRPNSNNKAMNFNLNLGASNPAIRANGATNILEFSNDGSTFNQIASTSGGTSGQNYLVNPSFETGTTSWTATTAVGSSDITNFTDGVKSYLLTFSTTAGNVLQNATPATQLNGVPMMASCFVKTSIATIQVCSLVAGSEQSCVAAPSTGNWSNVIAYMTGPNSGSVGVKVKTTSGTTVGTVNIDQCYVGKFFPLLYKAPTIQSFPSGSGTYTTPTNPSPLYIRVHAIGGGGGGGGSAVNNGTAGTGGTGGSSTFGSALIVASGGAGGPGVYASGVGGGAGGAASLGTGPVGIAIIGGQGGSAHQPAGTNPNEPGGNGGNGVYGGGGAGGIQVGIAATANTGGGGGGAGTTTPGTGATAGAGGGSGGYVDGIIASPSATYTYAVGAGGIAGTAGTSGNIGGVGGSGLIWVEEIYQ